MSTEEQVKLTIKEKIVIKVCQYLIKFMGDQWSDKEWYEGWHTEFNNLINEK